MVVSQWERSLSRPFMAFSMRSLPSALNGRVTTPMTKAPIALGQVRDDRGGARSGATAHARGHEHDVALPRGTSSGPPRTPRPPSVPPLGWPLRPVPWSRLLPRRTLFGACMDRRCLASLLHATKVAPETPAWFRRLMVLDPPPPQPMIDILMRKDCTSFRSSSSSALNICESPAFALDCNSCSSMT